MVTTAQKILFYVLLGLFVLMIIFSFKATSNLGKQGFDSCIEQRCEVGGQERCTKFREVNNCCMGAGGQMGVLDGQQQCVFS